MSYSPQLRTAVLLSGSGTAGAYHAGALRALHEAGIKIDVMSGRGIGIIGALFTAIDAAPKMWIDRGLWRRRRAIRLYRWRPALRAAALFALLAIAVLLVPLLVLSTAIIVYPLSFLVQMVSIERGHQLAVAYAAMIADAFAAGALPAVIPRLVTLCLTIAFLILAIAAFRSSGRSTRGHRDRGRWWGRLVASPWTSEPALRHFHQALWELFRGSSAARQPEARELSRRYTELLLENLGQPGFRELVISTLDLETRTDLIFALLGESRRQEFFHRGRAPAESTPMHKGQRRAAIVHYDGGGDLVDLSGVGRSQILDALAGGLSLSLLTEPQPIVFSPESYWKGETHRICDRPAAVGRLFHELSIAGVEQVIVVSADSDRSLPHRLSRPVGTLVSRVAEDLSAAENAAVRDAIATHRIRFRGVFLIQPTHNPVGPFDYHGAYDERSDRYQSLGELVDRGYEDAYRQFIEPVVGGDS